MPLSFGSRNRQAVGIRNRKMRHSPKASHAGWSRASSQSQRAHQLTPAHSASQVGGPGSTRLTMATASEVAPHKTKRGKHRLKKAGNSLAVAGGAAWAVTQVGEFALNIKRDLREEEERMKDIERAADPSILPVNATEREAYLLREARKEAFKKDTATKVVGTLVIASIVSTLVLGGWSAYSWYNRRGLKLQLRALISRVSELETHPAPVGTDDAIVEAREITKLKTEINTLKDKLQN